MSLYNLPQSSSAITDRKRKIARKKNRAASRSRAINFKKAKNK